MASESDIWKGRLTCEEFAFRVGCHPPSAGPRRRVTLTWFSLRVISGFVRAPDGEWTVYHNWYDTESQMRNFRGAGVLSTRLDVKNSPVAKNEPFVEVFKSPMLTAASLIGSLPTIILYLFLQRFYVEGLARGAVKG